MRTISSNPKAFHDYHILKEYVSGISLKGHEVKAIKLGKVNVKGSYVKPFKNELFIIGMNVSKYMGEGEELRDRKLLLNRKEIDDILFKLDTKGMTLVPLSIMLSKGLVKVKIALAKGKKNYDKRESLIKKDQKREIDREMKKRFRN